MIKPFIYLEPDDCIFCKAKHSLQVIDKYNKTISYMMATSYMKDVSSIYQQFAQLSIRQLQCRRCRKHTPIYWSNGIPCQMMEYQYDQYITQFKESSS